VLVLRHRDAERALGRQAIAALSLTLPPLPGEFGSGPDVPLTLSNDGPDPVEVLTVRVDRDGYRSQPVGVTVAAGDNAVLHLALEGSCPKAVPVSGPTGVLLTVRTARGQRTTFRVRTDGSGFSDDYRYRQQQACGLFPPDESVQASSYGVARRGRGLDVTLELNNLSVLPRTLTGMTAGDGFRVTWTPGLPQQLPTRGGLRVQLRLRITLRSCALATKQIKDADSHLDDAPFSFGNLYADVAGDGEQTSTELFLDDQLGPQLRSLVQQLCPPTR